MSADHAAPFVDDRPAREPTEGWRDPHDIIPAAFRERYGDAPSARAALRRAEQAPTDSDTDAMPRCPQCFNPSGVRRKTAGVEQAHQIDTKYKCSTDGCGHHFDEPAPSINEEYGEQAALSRWDDAE